MSKQEQLKVLSTTKEKFSDGSALPQPLNQATFDSNELLEIFKLCHVSFLKKIKIGWRFSMRALYSESGKSTFNKQMNIIHGAGEFTADEVRAYRQQIYQNVISAMRVLLYARAKSNIPWENPERSNNVSKMMKFIDVGGQRSQRQKWLQCFTDITSRLFMVASNEYDQVILEDRRTNTVVGSRSVFETIVSNRAFSNVSIIQFMSKSDLLEGD
ncbi:hypothetical protein KIN20_033949 [Parelaphostrongylus tenuis]|uniref:Uncharacterized protein n=1 Tax=Parelaphostrongylus tenuis TaxID=148309 RepID=A0AAD5R9E6_PARTN|nr:hypothetical protein KIN20_033949 [Parelaphostrongylus tenuis]